MYIILRALQSPSASSPGVSEATVGFAAGQLADSTGTAREVSEVGGLSSNSVAFECEVFAISIAPQFHSFFSSSWKASPSCSVPRAAEAGGQGTYRSASVGCVF